MIDFSSDKNFLEPSVNIDYNNIDTKDYKSLLLLLAKRYKVKVNQIELFNGYSSAIYSLLKFLDLKYCYIYSPCALEYKKASTNLSYEVRLINRFENIYLPIKDKSVVVFMNPSFLDGTYYDLQKLFLYWSSKDATVIIDESMLDFCNENSSIDCFSSYSNIYILKSFNKYYSNNDLNLSTVFSLEENITCLRKFEPEDKISKFDVKFLEESLKDTNFRNISNSVNIKNRVVLEKIFYKSEYVDSLFKSSSNSLLIKLKNITSEELQKKLEEKNIKIRTCKHFDFIDENYINIYVNSQEDIKELKEVIDVI